MGDVLAMVIPWAVSLVLMFVLLHWDESRLTVAQKARAWPPASLRVAVVYFGIVSLPVHFGRTRRSVLGVLQGLAWAVLIGAIDEGMSAAIEAIANGTRSS